MPTSTDEAPTSTEEVIQLIPLDLIDVLPTNVRKNLDEQDAETSLEDLAASIVERGVLQAVNLCELPNGRYGMYEGQRRLLASRLAQMGTIRAVVGPLRDPEVAVADSMVENLQRAGMHPLDEAQGFATLMRGHADDIPTVAMAKVARACGVSPTTVRKYLALLQLAPELQDALRAGEARNTMALAQLARRLPDNPERQMDVWMRISSFRQDIQIAIINRLRPDSANLGDLIDQASEGEIGYSVVHHCPWDCASIPAVYKEQVAKLANLPPRPPRKAAPAA
jgi:ParB family chromosome partitioning protein